MRMKQLLLFFLLVVFGVLSMSSAFATKPGVPWRVSIDALELDPGLVKVTVIIQGDADVQDLAALVTSNNATLLAGKETWKLSVHKGESIEKSLRYRYLSSGLVPQWKVVVSGSQQYASMSQIAITRFVDNQQQKSQSPQSRVRRGAEEYRSH
ncbi:MAG: hypothetical protein OEX19_04845 [Gammaproteobacteria bacterium]|nr:hypothetical protein [Gammaproteobacteria bacterium]